MRRRLIFATMMGFLSAELRADDGNYLDMFDLTYFNKTEMDSSVTTIKKNLNHQLVAFLEDDKEEEMTDNEEDRVLLKHLKTCLLNALTDPENENNYLGKFRSQLDMMVFNFKQKEKINIKQLEIFLKYLRRKYRNKIEKAIENIQKVDSGKDLLNRLRQNLKGQKIIIALSHNSVFIHPTGRAKTLKVCISPKRKSPRLRHITGLERKWRPLDVTLYHELLHCLHYLSCKNANGQHYFEGLTDKSIADQIGVIKPLLVHWFGERIDRQLDEWFVKSVLPWMKIDILGMSFFLEEFRTIFGDPFLEKRFCYDLSETRYLTETKRQKLIRLAYTETDFAPQFWWDIFKGNRILRWIDARILGK